MKKLNFFLTICFLLITSATSIAQIIITGYMKNPAGADFVNGSGGYEYVQFMATEDIKAADNFSIVLARNGNNKNTGWINPEAKTSYKINVKNLTVSKGSYFYLVGQDPKLNGQESNEFPAAANIIKFDQSKAGDDAQGAPVTDAGIGFFPGSNPTGIAIFNTTSPKANTRPIDAIFLGGIKATYAAHLVKNNDSKTSLGYTLPTYKKGKDALYFNVEDKDGNSLFLDGNNAEGRFYKFRGEFDAKEKKWITPRKLGIKLNPASLSDLESSNTIVTF